MTSQLSAFPFIQERSEATPGLWNQPFSIISANLAALDFTQSGITSSVASNLSIGNDLWVQGSVLIGVPPSTSTRAALKIGASSALSDYIEFSDASAQKSTYLLGSRVGGTADGLNIYDESGSTMIVSFSKQSIRFFQNVVGPVFDVGGALAKTLNAATFGTGANSNESRIQAAIDQAVIDVSSISRVYVPANMYPYSAGSVSFNTRIHMVREGGDWTRNDLKAYGAYGDGTRNDRAAFVAADASGHGACFIPPGTYVVGSGVTLSNQWVSTRSGIIKPSSGVTVTLAGTIEAGLYQIFDMTAGGNIRISDTPNPMRDIEVNPVWFGADQGPFANDSTVPFQKCFNSGAIRYFIPRGQYDVRSTVTIPAGRIQVRGVGINSAIYYNPNANNLPLFRCLNDDNAFFENFNCHLENTGNRTGITCFDFTTVNDADITAPTFERVYVDAFNRYGLSFTSMQHLKIERCRFSGMTSSTGTLAVAINVTGFLNRADINECRFLTNDKAMRFAFPNAVAIRDSSFEGDGSTSSMSVEDIIEIQNGNAFTFDNNYVEDERCGNGFAFIGLRNLGVQDAHIRDCHFAGDIGGVTYTDRFVSAVSSQNVVIANCNFSEVSTVFVESQNYILRLQNCTFADGGTRLTTIAAIRSKVSGLVEINNPETGLYADAGGAHITGASTMSGALTIQVQSGIVFTSRVTNGTALMVVDSTSATASDGAALRFQKGSADKWTLGYQLVGSSGQFEIRDDVGSRTALEIVTGGQGAATYLGPFTAQRNLGGAAVTSRTTNGSAQIVVDSTSATGSDGAQIAFQKGSSNKWQVGYQVDATAGEFEIKDAAGGRTALTITTSSTTNSINLNRNRLVSMRTTPSLDSTTLAVDECAFAFNASGASLAIRSGGTVWYFTSSASTKG